MPECQGDGALNEAIGQILTSAAARARTSGVRCAVTYIRDVAELDYGAAVRRHFDRTQLKEMFREMRRALPTLNREVYSVTNVDRLTAMELGWSRHK